MEKENDLEGFDVIPKSQRKEYVNQSCRHLHAKIIAKRSDGLIDCYCETCHMGGIYNSLEEFKRS